MKKNLFRTPLVQSGLILLVILLVFALIPSGDAGDGGNTLDSLFTSFFSIVLFLIALGIGIAACIASLVAIFFAVIALQSRDKAKEMWPIFKQKLFALFFVRNDGKEEKAQKALEAAQIQTAMLKKDHEEMRAELAAFKQDNQTLKSAVAALTANNATLKQEIEKLTSSATSKPIAKKEQDDTRLTEEPVAEEVVTEKTVTKEPSSDVQQGGIFSYIEKEADQQLFIETVEKALQQETTYAQIDKFLSKNLPKKLDQTLKAHPSLTRDFLRSKRNAATADDTTK